LRRQVAVAIGWGIPGYKGSSVGAAADAFGGHGIVGHPARPPLTYPQTRKFTG
jgi:hypothetical protein